MAQAKAITLEAEDLKYLQSTIRQRTIQAQVADRAKMLVVYDFFCKLVYGVESTEEQDIP